MQCPGDISESCGGELRMNIWSKVNTYGSFSALANGDMWESGICYVYDPVIKPFNPIEETESDDDMSLSYCSTYCADASEFNTHYAVQGGNHCMCGSEIQGILVRAVPQSLCDTKCTAETSTDMCGGENYFNLYKIGDV